MKENQKLIAVRRGCRSAHKIVKHWLRRFKIQRLKFDNIFFTDESSIDKENSI
jgi:hypothetical protein